MLAGLTIDLDFHLAVSEAGNELKGVEIRRVPSVSKMSGMRVVYHPSLPQPALFGEFANYRAETAFAVS